MVDLGNLLDNPNHDRFEIGDNNGDGIVDIHDCPFEPGSLGAKQQWAVIDADAHSLASVAKAKAAGFENATGWYHGKPLGCGKAGIDYGDYTFTTNKVHHFNGFDWDIAKKIAKRTLSHLPWVG